MIYGIFNLLKFKICLNEYKSQTLLALVIKQLLNVILMILKSFKLPIIKFQDSKLVSNIINSVEYLFYINRMEVELSMVKLIKRMIKESLIMIS